MRSLSQLKSLILLCIAAILLSFTGHDPEEGMFPISQIKNLNLKQAGLQIDPSEIFDPSGNGLNNALVRLGGCTGSFVSETGLIFTNHHCVFGTVASLSTTENNYLRDGFYARDTANELKTSLPCKIMLSFDDVSAEILQGISSSTSPKDKARIINENIVRVRKAEQEKHPDLTIEVSEMYVGKYYTLFRYKVLTDVRIVYVPPRSIGKFGGETDNWIWPRHNGDFSIVRAYENGKPYKPNRHLQINPSGTREGDFVFILGYPGRTYRHEPGEFLKYQRDYVLPIIADWFDYRIAALEQDAGDDTEKQIRYAGTIASLSNVTKNFKGKMQGFRRTSILQDRYEEQKEMAEWADEAGLEEYEGLFRKIAGHYEFKFQYAEKRLYLNQLYGSSGVFYAGQFIAQYKAKLDQMSKEQRDSFLTGHKEELRDQLNQGYRIVSIEVDKQLLTELLYRLGKLPEEQLIKAIEDIAGPDNDRSKIKAYVDQCYKKSDLTDKEDMMAMFDKNTEKFFKYSDDLMKLIRTLDENATALNEAWAENEEALNALLPKVADLKNEYYQGTFGTFVPDANATLRLTYGYVKGYSPEDAVYYQPFTTIGGILEKARDHGDYFLEDELLKKMRETEPADVLKHPQKDEVVVGFLYNLDTTGGNSGSPVINSQGEVVGINFDRAFSATINDYAWNESYSRSIGVDIRYVLYVIKYIGNADDLISEMGVAL